MIKFKDFIKGRKKLLIVILCSVLTLGTITSAFVIMFLKDEKKVVNTFSRANISIEIVEEFDKETKENVKVHNTSNMSVFIRTKIVPQWTDKDGNIVYKPCSFDDLDITWNKDFSKNWKLVDGYYYYKYAVPAGGYTENIINKAVVKTKNGFSMKLDVLGQAIQSSPVDASKEAWGLTPASDDELF